MPRAAGTRGLEAAMRRLQTMNPEDAKWYNWDLRPAPEGWVLEIDMRDRGDPAATPRHAHQGALLAALGLPAPDCVGFLPLSGEALARLTAALEPHAKIPWSAWEARDELDRQVLAGDLPAARVAADRLLAAAPDWQDGRMRRLALLIHTIRDADVARADLDSIPEGVIAPDERRRQGQSIALLDDDWVTYAREQAAMVADGAREPWAWETLGLARWAAGQLEASLEAFVAGQVDHPGNLDLANREAEMLAALGRRDEAIALLSTLSERGSAKSLALRGWIRREAAPVAAAADYAAAIAIDPEQAVARVGRGVQRMEAGDLAGARADLQPFTHCGWDEAAKAWARLRALE